MHWLAITTTLLFIILAAEIALDEGDEIILVCGLDQAVFGDDVGTFDQQRTRLAYACHSGCLECSGGFIQHDNSPLPAQYDSIQGARKGALHPDIS